jgi:TRAP-type C4-dicarboxylate transport system permease small subunit
LRAGARQSAALAFARVCRASAAAGVATLFACALVTVIDIVGRRVAGWSLPGLIDLSQLLVMTSVFLCIPYTFERRANVDVDLLFERLPRSLRVPLAVLWALLSAGFLAAVTWHAAVAAVQVLENGERSPTLGWPMVLYWAPMLFGCAAAAAVCVLQALRPGEPPDSSGSSLATDPSR